MTCRRCVSCAGCLRGSDRAGCASHVHVAAGRFCCKRRHAARRGRQQSWRRGGAAAAAACSGHAALAGWRCAAWEFAWPSRVRALAAPHQQASSWLHGPLHASPRRMGGVHAACAAGKQAYSREQTAPNLPVSVPMSAPQQKLMKLETSRGRLSLTTSVTAAAVCVRSRSSCQPSPPQCNAANGALLHVTHRPAQQNSRLDLRTHASQQRIPARSHYSPGPHRQPISAGLPPAATPLPAPWSSAARALGGSGWGALSRQQHVGTPSLPLSSFVPLLLLFCSSALHTRAAPSHAGQQSRPCGPP